MKYDLSVWMITYMGEDKTFTKNSAESIKIINSLRLKKDVIR